MLVSVSNPPVSDTPFLNPPDPRATGLVWPPGQDTEKPKDKPKDNKEKGSGKSKDKKKKSSKSSATDQAGLVSPSALDS